MNRIYVGRRQGGGSRVDVFARDGISALSDADGGAWGTAGPGTVTLAHALLADVFGTGASDGLAVTFAGDVLAELPRDGFALSEEDVRRWLQPVPARRLTGAEVIDHLGAVAVADEDDEARLLGRIIQRCWDERTLAQ
ncbi:MAG TPA: DUF6166 domain-containing protein [Solirubrobacteraceae bacterium]|jgi:hypothetical protein